MRGRGTVRRSLSERFGEEAHAVSNVLIKSAWGSDDPTKAAFAFLHANAFTEAGHPVQIFLLGEAVGLLRTPVADAVVPVGWPPLRDIFARTIELGVSIHV
jgi:predicted peroxiredoxin